MRLLRTMVLVFGLCQVVGCGSNSSNTEPPKESNFAGKELSIHPMADGSAYVFGENGYWWVSGNRRVKLDFPPHENFSIQPLADGAALANIDGNLFRLEKEVLSKVDDSGSEITGRKATKEGFYFAQNTNKDGLTDADRDQMVYESYEDVDDSY